MFHAIGRHAAPIVSSPCAVVWHSLALLAPASAGSGSRAGGRATRPTSRPRSSSRARGRATAARSPTEFVINQTLDHFDRTNARRLRTAATSRTTSFFDGTGPVFVCVGGETGPRSIYVRQIVASARLQRHGRARAARGALSARARAPLLRAVDAGGRRRRVKFLSSQQAVADLVAFHGLMTSRFGLAPANKWVSFGELPGHGRRLLPAQGAAARARGRLVVVAVAGAGRHARVLRGRRRLARSRRSAAPTRAAPPSSTATPRSARSSSRGPTASAPRPRCSTGASTLRRAARRSLAATNR